MYSCGPPHMAVQKQDDRHEHTFCSYVRIRDVVLKTCLGRWMIGRSGERGSGISVLSARHDDDDDDDKTSSPYSPHQNRTAERNRQTLLEMARCMIVESSQPKTLWAYAVMKSAVVRNKCFSHNLKQIPYYAVTERKPNLSKNEYFRFNVLGLQTRKN